MIRRVTRFVVICTRCETQLGYPDGGLFDSQEVAADMAEAYGWRTQVGLWWCVTCIDPATGDPMEPLSGPLGESPP